jgi:D-alanyl-D-alanine carboxypeptidase
MSWEAAIKKDLFEKLGMTSCGFGPAGAENTQSPTQPWSHTLEGERLKAIAPGVEADNPRAIGPAGTVHCNAHDWHKFLALFINVDGVRSGYVTTKTHEKLLSQAGDGPFTFSSTIRKDHAWAKGPVFVMTGSNRMNFALGAVAPNFERIYTINANAGHGKAEDAVTKILRSLTNLK